MANSRQCAVMSCDIQRAGERSGRGTALAVGGRAWNRSGGGGGAGRRGRLQIGIDPAGIHPPVEAVGGLRIDIVGMQEQAAEGCLDMAARAAGAVVKVEMAEGGV